jgi:hypothetical protein
MDIVNFGKYIFISFVVDWINLVELTHLDTSYCCKEMRDIFLSHLCCHTSLYGVKTNLVSDYEKDIEISTIIKRVTPICMFEWLQLRNLKVKSLILCNSNLISAHKILSFSFSKVKQLYVTVSRGNLVWIVCNIISKCIELEEIYFVCEQTFIDDIQVFHHIVRYCPKLKVCVYHSRMIVSERELLLLSRNCIHLETVDVRNWITDRCVVALCENCQNLTEVVLKDSDSVTGLSLSALQSASNLSRLDVVLTDPTHIFNNGIDVNAFIKLVTTHENKLQSHHLSGSIPINSSTTLFRCLIHTQKHLTELSVRGLSGVNDSDVIMVCSYCLQISKLDISFCSNLTVGGAVLAITNRLKHLSRVAFGQSRASIGKSMMFILAKRFSSLTVVDLAGYSLSGVPFIHVMGILISDIPSDHFHSPSKFWYGPALEQMLMSKCLHLEELSLSWCQQQFQIGLFEVYFGLCSNLRIIKINRIRSSDLVEDQPAPLYHQNCNPNCYCKYDVHDSTLAIIAAQFPLLVDLNVGRRHRVTDFSMLKICENCPLLTNLDCRYCWKLTDITLSALAEHCHLLTCLNLDGCCVTNQGIGELSIGCQKLISLSKIDTIGLVTRSFIDLLVSSCADLQEIVSSNNELSYSPESGVYRFGP